MYATAEQVKKDSVFPEVQGMEDARVDSYIERANLWLYAVTGSQFSNVTDDIKLKMLKRVTVLLVDYLFYWDQDDMVEDQFEGQITSEKIGNYQYTVSPKAATESGETGMQELDTLIGFLKSSIRRRMPGMLRVTHKRR
jgi:hypothetical protein